MPATLNTDVSNKSIPSNNEIDIWFTEIVGDIKADHFMLTEGVAPKEKKDFYFDIISGNDEAVWMKMRQTTSLVQIAKLLKDYMDELKKGGLMPLKLLVALSDSKILVWSEINDDDENTEDALLIAEARINGKYHHKGFYLTSTIVEKSDNITPPPHYQPII
jgi:hypothetical protein